MNLDEIKASIDSSDSQARLKAITALKDYDAETAIPLLLSRVNDPEFLVRSFVAMGLGRKQSAESFAALLEILKRDRDTNVRAEAANSLSLYGKVSTSHLVLAFYQNENWLVRRSILAAMIDLESPDELLDVCTQALKDEDLTVQEAGAETLGVLANSSQSQAALTLLVELAQSDSWRMRARVAYTLKRFSEPKASEVLTQLRQDSHHRVVAAALEELLPQ
jgi:HEAT repeat protein